MSLIAVGAWRDRLRSVDAAAAAPHLSPEGAAHALTVALDALGDDALAAAAAVPGAPFRTATLVCARTVFTAPLEWCAVLLSRGTAVRCKLPAGVPGLGPVLAEHAAVLGLPLVVTEQRGAVQGAELVVAMGADATVADIGTQLAPDTRFLGFGNRYSVAWVRRVESLTALAEDAALHDGAGCMSPVAVFTDLPTPVVLGALGAAMADAQRRWPRGPVSAADAARTRTRRALARVVGAVAEGDGWSVHALPVEHFLPASLPRSLVVHQVVDVEQLRGPLTGPLSTVGTDDPTGLATVLDAASVRVCAPGEMQRPPLLRRHDGVDWIRETARPG